MINPCDLSVAEDVLGANSDAVEVWDWEGAFGLRVIV